MQEIYSLFPQVYDPWLSGVIQEATVSSNVSSIFKAQIIGILESHCQHLHKKFQAAVLCHIQSNEEDEIYVECPSNESMSRMKNLVLKNVSEKCLKGWDSPQVTPLLSKFKEIRNPVYKAIINISSQNTLEWNKDLQKLVMIYNLRNPKSEIEPLGVMNILVYGSQDEVTEMKKRLTKTGKKWLIEAVSKFNEKLFPMRHQSLIDTIKQSNAKRAIFFSGESHGDTERSIFHDEAKRLNEEFSSKPYIILNPNNLSDDSLEGFVKIYCLK